MKNGVIINGTKHILVPTLNLKNDCQICSLKKECEDVDGALYCIFPNTPNSHFEIEK